MLIFIIHQPPPPFTVPAISLIIPMYNAEKYIGECLDSLLAQTLKNIEVIVVDDCSTDNSVTIVESYFEKFGGRLKLEKTKKNSGGCAVPRNVGLPFSRGEYIFFMDADDLITQNALSEMYSAAKNFNVDVVYTQRWFNVPENFGGVEYDKNFIIGTTDEKNFKNVPVFESDDRIERVRDLIEGRFHAVVWKKLVLRDLLIRNEIDFPNFRVEDFCWTLKLLYYAKKILRIPNPVYFYRHVPDSISRQSVPIKLFYQTLHSLVEGVKAIEAFMMSTVFFRENVELHYAVLNCFAEARLKEIIGLTFQTPPPVIYEIIDENQRNIFKEHSALISYVLTFASTQQKIFAVNQQQFNQFAAQAQQRIAELESELKRKEG